MVILLQELIFSSGIALVFVIHFCCLYITEHHPCNVFAGFWQFCSKLPLRLQQISQPGTKMLQFKTERVILTPQSVTLNWLLLAMNKVFWKMQTFRNSGIESKFSSFAEMWQIKNAAK